MKRALLTKSGIIATCAGQTGILDNASGAECAEAKQRVKCSVNSAHGHHVDSTAQGKHSVSDTQGDCDSNAVCIKRSLTNNDDNGEQQKHNEVDRRTKILLEEVSSPLVIFICILFSFINT